MADVVQLLNELVLSPYDGQWISQTLNRKDLGRIYTLPTVTFLYSADTDTSVELGVTGDGGANWPFVQAVVLPGTDQTIEEVGRVASAVRVTGWDLRIRLVFDQAILSKFHVYIPPLIERGKHYHGVR